MEEWNARVDEEGVAPDEIPNDDICRLEESESDEDRN